MSTFKYNRIDKNNAAVLLVDHQTGLFSLVKDFGASEFRNNVLALATTAKFFNLPTILTTSFEQGPNGPMMPEIKEMFPNAPYIPRPGQINAWDNEDFVKAVEATGKQQLIIAGIVTDVCVAFCALSALEAGYDVFVVTDASGTLDEACRYAAWNRMSSAGAQLVNWFSVTCELHRDWRNDIEGLGRLLAQYIPDYKNLMTSYAATTNARFPAPDKTPEPAHAS
jgi:nicotinamidase-related amidase